MRTITFIICLVIYNNILSQTSISDSKTVWRFNWYDFAGHLSDEETSLDTLYTIQKFPKKDGLKIYYDNTKTSIASLFNYDSIKKTLIVRHYRRDGKLMQEFCTRYQDKKHFNPAVTRVKDFVYLKIFHSDSLVCEMTGQENIITAKYKNYINDDYFEQTMYFSSFESYRDEYIGSDLWKYFKNGNIKSICKTKREDSTDSNVTVTTLIYKCVNFDNNGCLIKDK